MITKQLLMLALLATISLNGFANEGAQKAADNTGVNQRDVQSNAKTLTPPDQSRGSERDVELTRRIRELVVKEDSLSLDAQNVKIITLSGVTTLRGPVASSQERARIARIASNVLGGPKFVRNQLEVKPAKTN